MVGLLLKSHGIFNMKQLLCLLLFTSTLFGETDEDIAKRLREAANPPQIREWKRKNLPINETLNDALKNKKNVILWINFDNPALEEKFPEVNQTSLTNYTDATDKRIILGRYENGMLRRIDLKTTAEYNEIKDYFENKKTPSYIRYLNYIK